MSYYYGGSDYTNHCYIQNEPPIEPLSLPESELPADPAVIEELSTKHLLEELEFAPVKRRKTYPEPTHFFPERKPLSPTAQAIKKFISSQPDHFYKETPLLYLVLDPKRRSQLKHLNAKD
ncbi:MAG: hypothetical protein FJZ63_06190 [Chlamydiae bacterium]|nr:hypothetical protein [Chlamydiota bacterium]